MESTKENVEQAAWPPLSQSQWKLKQDLLRQRATIEAQADAARRRIAEAEAIIESMTDSLVRPAAPHLPGLDSQALGRAAEVKRNAETHLAALERALGKLDAQIAALESPEAIAARARDREALRALAEKRTMLDKVAEGVPLAKLPDYLQKRGEINEAMRGPADRLELSCPLDFEVRKVITEQVFGAGTALAAASEAFTARLLGKPLDGIAYRVRVQELFTEENLISNGVHHFGDEIVLPADEFFELHRTDRPNPPPGAILTSDEWKRRPVHLAQAVCTETEWQEAIAKAKKQHLDLDDFFHDEDKRRAAADRRAAEEEQEQEELDEEPGLLIREEDE